MPHSDMPCRYTPIGGFFPLEIENRSLKHSVFSYLRLSHIPHVAFHNSRSALFYLLQRLTPARLWLPAYCCGTLTEAPGKAGIPIVFYPVTQDFSPDTVFLKKHLRRKDAVLAIDYFGRYPDAEFLSFVKNNPAITWIEDRAQALLPGDMYWGHYVLYSFRKLMGVPDGGVVLSPHKPLPLPDFVPFDSCDFMQPSLLRFEDQEEQRNAAWYAVYREAEASSSTGAHPMSRLTKVLLQQMRVLPMLKRREKNFLLLYQSLQQFACIRPDGRPFVPFGFPVSVKNAAEVKKHLYAAKIFAATHWTDLPSDKKSFPFEHQLAARQITLPCDHRYNARDMKRIIRCILELHTSCE